MNNLIRNYFQKVKNTKGDNFKCIFRDDSFIEDLIKAVILNLDNSFFYFTYIKVLSNEDEYLSLVSKDNIFVENSHLKPQKNSYSENMNSSNKIIIDSSQTSRIDIAKKKLSNFFFSSSQSTKLKKCMSIENENETKDRKGMSDNKNPDYDSLKPNMNMISNSILISKINQDQQSKNEKKLSLPSKEGIQIDIDLFLEFFGDFCNNLLNYMPSSLKILLKIIHEQAMSIFTIKEKDSIYPIFILLFFKFYCNPTFHSLYDFPNDEIDKTKILNLNKLFINITSNTPFQMNNDALNVKEYNTIIEICNKKLKTILDSNIVYLSNEVVQAKSVEALRIIDCPLNMFYNDCEFCLFCLEDYCTVTMTMTNM